LFGCAPAEKADGFKDVVLVLAFRSSAENPDGLDEEQQMPSDGE